MNLGSHDDDNNNNNNNSFKEASLTSFDLPLLQSPLRPPPFAAETTASGPKFTEEYLKALIKDKDVDGWNYAIFWRYTDHDRSSSRLVWGDGYYDFDRHDQSKCTAYGLTKYKQQVLPILGWSPYAFSDYDLTYNLWLFAMSKTCSFTIVANKGDGFFRDQQLRAMMRERVGLGQGLGIETLVFIPVSDGALELGSAHLTLENSDLINQVMGLLNRIRPSQFPYYGYMFHRGEAIRCSLNVERLPEILPKRAQNERENHGHEHNSLKRQLAGKEKISEQILEQPWPLLTESSDGNEGITSYSNSVEFSGPS